MRRRANRLTHRGRRCAARTPGCLRGGAPAGARGFTLLELIVVLALAGMLAALVAPSFSGTLASARLRAGAAELRATMSFARTLAAAQSRPRSVAIDPATGQYGVAGEGGRRLPEGVRVDSIRVGGAVAEYGENAGGGPPARVRFFPDGTAEEAEVFLSSSGGGSMRVSVDPLTGLAEAGT